ncbi:class I SAM-dependent methyltransferase [Dactylosporangium sp. CA-139114]|uniref:class I SAM-dependent methyltransferase n=1 Tax=Dactylosporangium sp. CA-139114 TaxID=3239931 RepID=UPI003D996416
MPTLPSPEHPHEQRAVAESFGADAERYDRARPGYPAALIERILAAGPGRRVLDVGCGTGIVARQLQAAGCSVLGVDPDPRMAGVARRQGLDVEVARIEAWDPAGRVFDAVVAGQTWHWVEPVAGAATAARALRPGGLLALFWNGVEPPPQVAEATGNALREHIPAPGRIPVPARFSFGGEAYRPLADRAAEGMRAAGGFGEPEPWTLPWRRDYTRDEWLEQVSTSGGVNRLPAEILAGVLADLGRTIPDTFPVVYSTVAVAARRG